jgi:hypothetical protein
MLEVLLRTARRRAALTLAIALPAAFAAWEALRIRSPWVRCGGALVRADTVASCGACGRTCGTEHASAACVDGNCVLTCAEGFADCDGHPGNGCEVDLKHDRFHCGLCTRTCNGAACEGGACAARFVGNGDTIAADEAAVYAVGATVTKYPVDGSDPLTLAPGSGPAPPDAGAKVDDATFAYWVEAVDGGALVRRAPRQGGEPATVVAHPAEIRHLVANGTHLFWSDAKQRIFMAPKQRAESGGKPAGNRLP